MYANYRRLKSVQQFEPPYVWSGLVRLNEVMYPGIFGWGWKAGQEATYVPKLNFHPLYQGNDRNVVLGPGNPLNPTVVGISAECRDLRPDRPYGVRTGYVSRHRWPLASDPIGDGRFHEFRWVVASRGRYAMYWDDELVVDVVEQSPYTIDPGPHSVGLRLDFLDVEFRDMKVSTPVSIKTGTPRDYAQLDEAYRIVDTRVYGSRIRAGQETKVPLRGRAPSGAAAVVLSLVAVNPDTQGYLTLYRGGKRPNTSNLNFTPGGAQPGFAVVPVQSDGSFYVYSTSNVDLVADMVGYYY